MICNFDAQPILDQILKELREIRQLLEPKQPVRCTEIDREILVIVLSVAVAIFGSKVWTVQELLRHPDASALSFGNPQGIGNSLARAAIAGASIEGLRVQNMGRQSNKTFWMVTPWSPGEIARTKP
jgi:hypothetical protein